jgi:hypothetical protein
MMNCQLGVPPPSQLRGKDEEWPGDCLGWTNHLAFPGILTGPRISDHGLIVSHIQCVIGTGWNA